MTITIKILKESDNPLRLSIKDSQKTLQYKGKNSPQNLQLTISLEKMRGNENSYSLLSKMHIDTIQKVDFSVEALKDLWRAPTYMRMFIESLY